MAMLDRFAASDVPTRGPAEIAAPVGGWTSGITPPNLPGAYETGYSKSADSDSCGNGLGLVETSHE
jgi:hypothetical protein